MGQEHKNLRGGDSVPKTQPQLDLQAKEIWFQQLQTMRAKKSQAQSYKSKEGGSVLKVSLPEITFSGLL